MEPSSLNDIILDYRKSDQLSLADASEGIEDYQQNQDEENYKNGWCLLCYVKLTLFCIEVY